MHTNTFKGVKLQERVYKKIFLEYTRGVLSYSSGSGITDFFPMRSIKILKPKLRIQLSKS